MRYTATDRYATFTVSWSAVRAGQPSLDHRHAMLMTAPEAHTFAKMQREQRIEEVTERWTYSIGEGTF